MFKTIGMASLALAGLLAFAAPRKADARVRVGIGFGAPVYTYPVAPAYPAYGYPDPNYGYAAPDYAYPAPAPVYSYPGYVAQPGFGIGFGWSGHGDHDDYRGHDGFRGGHESRGGQQFRGGHESRDGRR